MKISMSKNAGRRKRLRERNQNLVTGDRLSTDPPLLVKKIEGDSELVDKQLAQKGKPIVKDKRSKEKEGVQEILDPIAERTDPKIPAIPDSALVASPLKGKHMSTKIYIDPEMKAKSSSVKKTTKVYIDETMAKAARSVSKTKVYLDPDLYSESADVIFSPATQGTQFSSKWAIKANLERRMPETFVKVSDVSGEGVAQVAVSHEFYIDNQLYKVSAKCLVSPSDIAVHEATVTCNGRTYDVDPADRPRSPEDALVYIRTLAQNVCDMRAKKQV